MASLMEANDAGFGCDLALWEPALTAAVDGLAVGTAGVVVGWTGEVCRVAPSCITARERPVVARPEELAPRERPPIAGAEVSRARPLAYANACAHTGFVGDGLRWWFAAANVGNADALYQLANANMDGGRAAPPETPSATRAPQVPIFGEAPSVERALDLYAQAGARGSADALYALGVLRYVGHGPDCPRPRGNQIFNPTSIECSLIDFHAGPRDVAAARAHYGAAAELGHEGAMLCLYDALGDGDADGDEWLHHSAFLGTTPLRLAERASPEARAVVGSARLVARVGALERARKDARLAPRKPAARGSPRAALIAQRPRQPPPGRPARVAAPAGRGPPPKDANAPPRGRAPPGPPSARALRRLAHFNNSR
ncbi:protein N-acetylglucosaminyltransferase [Aureococcus anophagefferens]|nr:protein N-acetylglucosaminyltransferase [Aureococcus anophagefferens]